MIPIKDDNPTRRKSILRFIIIIICSIVFFIQLNGDNYYLINFYGYPLHTYEYPWKYSWNSEISMHIPWISMIIHECPWITKDSSYLYGFSWFSMAFHRIIKIFMDFWVNNIIYVT